MIRPCAVSLCLVLLAASLSAQDSKPAPSKTLRFLSFGDVLEGWTLLDPVSGELQGLPLIANRSRSGPVRIRGDRTHVYLYSAEDAPTKEKPQAEPTVRMRLPGPGDEYLVVLFPLSGDSRAKVAGAAFPDGPDGFPLGSYKFLNVTRRPLVGVLGDKPFRVDPGKTIVVTPSEPQGGLPLILADRRAPELPLLRRGWIYRSNCRTLVFLRETGGPRSKMLLDSLPQSEDSMNESAEVPPRDGALKEETP